MNMRSTEPALNTGLNVGMLTTIYILINIIWPGLLSDDLQDAISGVALIAVPPIMGWLIRRKVFAPASVGKLQRQVINLKERTDRQAKTIESYVAGKGVPYKESSVEDY